MALLMGALVKRKRGQLMKILIVGGVAAGTKDISYAGCGLPYYVGGLIPEKEDLIVNTPAKFTALTGAKVLVEREVTALDAQKKELTAHNLRTGVQENYDYDECIIACGASSIVPPLPGVSLPGVFTMRTPQDAIELREYLEQTGEQGNQGSPEHPPGSGARRIQGGGYPRAGWRDQGRRRCDVAGHSRQHRLPQGHRP